MFNNCLNTLKLVFIRNNLGLKTNYGKKKLILNWFYFIINFSPSILFISTTFSINLVNHPLPPYTTICCCRLPPSTIIGRHHLPPSAVVCYPSVAIRLLKYKIVLVCYILLDEKMSQIGFLMMWSRRKRYRRRRTMHKLKLSFKFSN